MFNPLFPFTTEVLETTVQRGCIFFIRNTYMASSEQFYDRRKTAQIISHYNDPAKAMAHYRAISQDGNRFLYDWSIPEQRLELFQLAKQANEKNIYSTYFLPDYHQRFSKDMREKINRYMYRHTNWKPGKKDTIAVDCSLQFGALYATLSFGGQKLQVKFEDIEWNR